MRPMMARPLSAIPLIFISEATGHFRQPCANGDGHPAQSTLIAGDCRPGAPWRQGAAAMTMSALSAAM